MKTFTWDSGFKLEECERTDGGGCQRGTKKPGKQPNSKSHSESSRSRDFKPGTGADRGRHENIPRWVMDESRAKPQAKPKQPLKAEALAMVGGACSTLNRRTITEGLSNRPAQRPMDTF